MVVGIEIICLPPFFNIIKQSKTMKNFLSYIFIILFFFLLGACCCLNKVSKNNNSNGSMFGYEKIINSRQLDSIIKVDSLSLIEEWMSMVFYDYETSEPVKQRMYIKELTDSSEVTYVLIEKDTLYLIIKRIAKGN